MKHCCLISQRARDHLVRNGSHSEKNTDGGNSAECCMEITFFSCFPARALVLS